ncbi:alpha-L-arabinofuranosidase 1-like [Asparagus officinalis]|uniref:alpha-L-arabinofuranosidase 1-like n=1 Tax=Asparagus officinalis TaxID=4686 RepID=UPI00098E61E7|nr:alpha-L-arabinofuranosidase 1-like [Asparagus officinalis]
MRGRYLRLLLHSEIRIRSRLHPGLGFESSEPKVRYFAQSQRSVYKEIMIGLQRTTSGVLFCALFLISAYCQIFAYDLEVNQTAFLKIDASPQSGRKIPDHLFGIFFEEINHAGAGGIWAELVSNRGFEAGGPNTPSNIDPWGIIGNETFINVLTDRSSCFNRNKVALRMEVLCDPVGCPDSGVGVYNPGYWGMNIEQGKTYKVVLHVMSSGSLNLSVSLTSSDGMQTLASNNIIASASQVSNWTKIEFQLESKGTNSNSRLQLTTNHKGVIWLDQVSVMPTDTYKVDSIYLMQIIRFLVPCKQLPSFVHDCFTSR